MRNKITLFKLGIIFLAFAILLFSISFEAFKTRYYYSQKLDSGWLIKTYFNHIKDQLYPFKTSHFYLVLSTKRLNEANFLWHKGYFDLAKQQLIKAIIYHCRSQNTTPLPLPSWAKKLSPADPYYWWLAHSLSCPPKN